MAAQKLVVYVMHGEGPGSHPFLIIRKTTRNPKGRYVTGDEVFKVGVLWPTPIAKTENELATIIGQAILEEVWRGAGSAMDGLRRDDDDFYGEDDPGSNS
jgi:hypothetical protein